MLVKVADSHHCQYGDLAAEQQGLRLAILVDIMVNGHLPSNFDTMRGFQIMKTQCQRGLDLFRECTDGHRSWNAGTAHDGCEHEMHMLVLWRVLRTCRSRK
jgi:hypothetical protein